MSFLIPLLPWVLPAASLPLIIHLFSRRNTRRVEFSTLRFLREMEHESIRRLRWYQWALLLLRTVMLLTVFFLLARPVVEGYYQSWIGAAGSTFTVIVVDDSFSTTGVPNDLPSSAPADGATLPAAQYPHEIQHSQRAYLNQIVSYLAGSTAGGAGLSGQGRALILCATDGRIAFDGATADLPPPNSILSQCAAGYRKDDFTAVLDTLRSPRIQNMARLFANREIFILSDFQAHQQIALQQLGTDTTTWGDWHLFLVPLVSEGGNIAITRAEVRSPLPLVGELMDIAVTLRNTGPKPQQSIPVQLVLNDIRAGQLVVDLDADQERTVVFQVAPSRAGHQRGYAELQPDGRNGDNRFYFHTTIPSRVGVLLIESPAAEWSFLRAALDALAQENPQIQLHVRRPADLAWSPRNLDLIMLSGLELVPNLLVRQLKTYLSGEGTLAIVPGTTPQAFNALEILCEELRLPPIDTTAGHFTGILNLDRKSLNRSFLKKAFQHEWMAGELTEIYNWYRLQVSGQDEVLIKAANNRPMLVRSASGAGTVFLFAVPFHLEWTDLPLRGSFIPLLHRLLYWHPARQVLADVRVGDQPVMAVSSRQTNAPILMQGPDDIRMHLIPEVRSKFVTLKGLERPGIYTINLPGAGRGTERTFPGKSAGGVRADNDGGVEFRVNIPAGELTSGYLSSDVLKHNFVPGKMSVLRPSDGLAEGIRQARFGRELWRPLLYALIILVVIEMVLGNVFSGRRRHG